MLNKWKKSLQIFCWHFIIIGVFFNFSKKNLRLMSNVMFLYFFIVLFQFIVEEEFMFLINSTYSFSEI